MRVCEHCGEENSDRARFCQACGTELPVAITAEQRKTVTIVFTDVIDSTVLGETLDPEAVRGVMARYFEAMREIVERHGGTVEKFIGDAVMAVFGVPHAHEDDALRACRAAEEMRERLDALNKELERDVGVSVRMRTGINTGEVVAGAGQTLVTGDVANVAARLEQAAAPGEILLGELTFKLVRSAVDAKPIEPLDLKGKSEPVSALRLVRVIPGVAGHARRMDSPMVGRQREATLLQNAYDGSVADATCQLFTILGTAGVGKSRLAQEFIARVGDANVLQGRCLPYGDGITFWPVLEVVKAAAGLSDFDAPEVVETKICDVLEGEEHQERICRQVAQLMGLSEISTPEETFWAIRRLFEAMARRRPLVLVFDDLHWAEPTFLDLVEHLADWSRGVPMLLLCMARPELLDERSAWGGGKLNAITLSLEPLSVGESAALVSNLLDSDIPEDVERRIAHAAEGNPLFVEEFLAMLVDDGELVERDGGWVPTSDLSGIAVPPSISALLSARLDRLVPEERDVLAAAAVIGKDSYLGAVRSLLPDKPAGDVSRTLTSLVRKQFIGTILSTLPGEDAFSFRHMLIRDAAYESMPKQRRAELHERVADWLLRTLGDRIAEHEEILGYHLERAALLLRELGPSGARDRELAERAATHLGAAAGRAIERGDHPAAVDLSQRAAGLTEDDRARVLLLMDAGTNLVAVADYDAASAVLEEAAAAAEGDPALEVRVGLERALLKDHVDLSEVTFISEAERAIPVLERAGDDAGLARAWSLVALRGGVEGDYTSVHDAQARALHHAHRSRERGVEIITARVDLAEGYVWGPTPVGEELAMLDALEPRLGEDRLVRAFFDNKSAGVLAMSGDVDAARERWSRAHDAAIDLGDVDAIGFISQEGTMIAMLAGDPVDAEAISREAFDLLARVGNQLATVAADGLGQALLDQGRLDEALEMTRYSEEAGMAPSDPFQASWQLVRAKILARRGAFDEAERLARTGAALLEGTQFMQDRATSLVDLAEVLRLSGKTDEAEEVLREALRMFEEKGNVVSAAKVWELLADGSG